MRKLILVLALGFSAALANAANTTATLTADNEFWLYTGNASGSNLTLRGYGNNWGAPFTFSFDTAPGEYLYVAAHDWGGPQAWQGVFSTAQGNLYSNTASWQYVVASSSDTSTAGVVSNIAHATWATPLAETDNGSGPWGATVHDVNAKWIWHDTVSSNSSSDSTYAIFRTIQPAAPVPEASSYAMLLGGLGTLAFLRRRQSKKLVK
ncbi:MAG: PEP-CTERM sorting domain-containing protein [Burkholderiales bacterium]|nr:PEP-CTERM sorting domain-containing protein [Burkholderiales bacterium]